MLTPWILKLLETQFGDVIGKVRTAVPTEASVSRFWLHLVRIAYNCTKITAKNFHILSSYSVS